MFSLKRFCCYYSFFPPVLPSPGSHFFIATHRTVTPGYTQQQKIAKTES